MLRAHRDYGGLFEDWFYWAPLGSAVEVDFLLRRGKELVAVETKSTPAIAEADLRGLRALQELPGLRRRLVVHGGTRASRTSDGIDILPVAALLREVEEGSLVP